MKIFDVTEWYKPQATEISFISKEGTEILKIKKEGIEYKGEILKDSGEVYTVLKNVLYGYYSYANVPIFKKIKEFNSCPFCGTKEAKIFRFGVREEYSAVCCGCGFETPRKSTEEELFVFRNKRYN